MAQVNLTDEQRAILNRNLSADKRVINAQRRETKRQRDEQRAKARSQKVDVIEIAACFVDTASNIKIGKTWVR